MITERDLRMGVLEAIGKARGDYIGLVYELWQENVIPEEIYLREIRKAQKRTFEHFVREAYEKFLKENP